jgi:hypothetical protein
MASAPLTITGISRPAFFSGRRFSNDELLWLAFVIVQALDGAMSYLGVSMHGQVIEGNPLVAWYLTVLGPAAGFAAAKLFAVTCGAVLYVTGRHTWVAVLTLVYLIFAVVPWVGVLSAGV